jgi:hypothetical protein
MLKPLSILLLAASPALAAQEWMTRADITYVFVGREVAGTYRNGATFSEIYRRVGAVEYKDRDGALSGTWSLQNDTFCTQYKSAPGGCYRVRLHSANCFEYWLVGETGTIATQWIARSWQTKYPSTCPKSDGASG